MKYITEYRTIAIQHAVPLSSSATWEQVVEQVERGGARSVTTGDCTDRQYEDSDAMTFVKAWYKGEEVAT